MHFDTTDLIASLETDLITLEAEKQEVQKLITLPEQTEDEEDVTGRPRSLEELDAQIKADQALLDFFKEHKTLTYQELLTFRDETIQRGQKKRRVGGPYEGYEHYQMSKTEEGKIVSACQDLFQQMNVLVFTVSRNP